MTWLQLLEILDLLYDLSLGSLQEILTARYVTVKAPGYRP